ncbi:hypothetical protein KO528_15680 [Saccharophagus degradans]|uniref:hypothetical protein n=1 Tax=Saccharophagus degradans TaxID=86304 RepID=UPI001C08E796|nr:hypothetical protein [Saccharophagus degradans]MBU2986805.1 hypothetical protein [Saccharophagus degradans]
MIDESNPAGRLHKILSQAKSRPDKAKVRDVWAMVLGVDQNDALVTRAVVELYSLSNEIQLLIKMNEQLNHKLYLKSFSSIDRAFFPLNLSANWNSVKQHLHDEALTRLQFCAEQLSDFYAEDTLSEEDLAEIIEKTESLFKAVYSSSLPGALRLSLLEEVERLRSAISMYRIKGAKGLKETLQGTIGAVIANQVELQSASENNPDVLKRLGELIDKLDSFTTRAMKLKKLLTKPIRFLIEKATDPDSENAEANS